MSDELVSASVLFKDELGMGSELVDDDDEKLETPSEEGDEEASVPEPLEREEKVAVAVVKLAELETLPVPERLLDRCDDVVVESTITPEDNNKLVVSDGLAERDIIDVVIPEESGWLCDDPVEPTVIDEADCEFSIEATDDPLPGEDKEVLSDI